MLKRLMIFLITNLLILLTFSVVLSILVRLLGIDAQSNQIAFLAIFCLVFGMVGSMISLLLSRWTAKRLYGIELIDENSPAPYNQIYLMVKKLAQKARIPMPEVGIYHDDDPNAFATGPTKRRSLVAVSTGLLNNMNEEEIEAVLGHEISHIENGDMVTMALLMGLVNALVMFLARIIAIAIDSALRGDDEEGEGLGFFGYIITVWVLETILFLLAAIPIAWFSRYREYRADEGGARLTSNQAMASALQRLGELIHGTRPDPFAPQKIQSKGRVSLFATHPPLEKRVERLLKKGRRF